MTDGQRERSKVHGRGTPRSMRGPHPAAGPTVSLSLASWLPARTRAWPTIPFVPLASSLASNPSATRAFAMRPECTSPRLPGRSRQPRSREPLRVHLQRIRGSYVRRTQGPLSPAAPGIRLRWNSAAGRSTGIAMRIATVWPDATASRACRIVAAKMVLPLAGPAGCPRAGDRRLCRRHLRDLEAVRGIHSTECCRALQTAAAEMAAVQAAQRTMAGRSRSRFRSRGGATPTKSSSSAPSFM